MLALARHIDNTKGEKTMSEKEPEIMFEGRDIKKLTEDVEKSVKKIKMWLFTQYQERQLMIGMMKYTFNRKTLKRMLPYRSVVR